MDVPLAKRIPVARVLHGETVADDYAWLRDRDDPDTIAYLESENDFTERATRHLAALRDRIFEEIRSRVQESDVSAPARRDDWWYAIRTEEGRQYPTHVRRHGGPDGPEKLLLDVEELARGREYLDVGVFSVSPDHRLAAYSVDESGDEHFTLRIRDLESGGDLADEIRETYYTAAWSSDGRVLFYTTVDAAHRPYRVHRHEVGTDPSQDTLVVEEPDDRFFVSLRQTQDRRYVLVAFESQTTSEVRYLDADDPTGPLRSVIERIPGVEYWADHHEGRWVVISNRDALDGRLFAIPVGGGHEEEILPHEPGRKLTQALALQDHIVVSGRRAGLTALTVVPAGGGAAHDLAFDEEVYTVRPERNLEYATDVLRVSYASLTTPERIVDVDLGDGHQDVVKETPVRGGFERSDYLSSREWATAADGTRIPISIVHRADLDTSRPAPLLLYGYGSYEATIDPWFSIPRLSLLDRGVVFALAHVRGGGEMGKAWYESGKLARKANTFTDFVACAEHLVDAGWSSPDRLAARGGSAGGLLMGAVANLRPELFRAIVAEVPFVDVINSMLDPSLPLTVIEWEEWGNPQDPDQYRWMRAYAPYENVRDTEYPAMLVTAGLNDPRVAFWEPAKWVAKLRSEARNRGPLLLKTKMAAGHGGPTGRYDTWREEAFVLAWLLDQWGVASDTAAG